VNKSSNSLAVHKSYSVTKLQLSRDIKMSKLLIALLFSALATTTFAADTDKQTDGAELGTNETPQAQDQTKNSRDTTAGKPTKKRNHVNKKAKHNHQKAGSAEENPLQPTDSEPAPGAATR
jgi:hypothetical protein